MPQNKVVQPLQLQRGRIEDFGPIHRVANIPGATFCCLPTGCLRYREEPIVPADPRDSVRVVCNNETCTEGNWMHGDCFQQWEQQVLGYLRSCGRARSWSEKQRLQNLWTKKGYDLAYKACDCKCKRGHLRKDLDYVPLAKTGEDRKLRKGKKGRAERSLPVININRGLGSMIGVHSHHQLLGNNGSMKPQLRVRTSSFGSTGSSPPSSAGTPPLTPGAGAPARKFEFFLDADQAAAGNIFKRRTNFEAFSVLPRYQQNPYHIKMEDEGPHGNDETRCFVLSNLSTHQVTDVNCVVCQTKMPVFDRYPLIDGTFFLSPVRYNTDLQVLSDHKMMYLNAICMGCLEGSRHLRCVSCKCPWSGQTLVLGTMYSYDIFAAAPCCAYRLSCKSCRRPVLDPSCRLNFFSEYSRMVQCPYCRAEDYHFIKSIGEGFMGKDQHPLSIIRRA